MLDISLIDDIRLGPIVGYRPRCVSGVSDPLTPSNDVQQSIGIICLSQFWLTGRTYFFASRAFIGCDACHSFYSLQCPDLAHNRLLQGGYDITIFPPII